MTFEAVHTTLPDFFAIAVTVTGIDLSGALTRFFFTDNLIFAPELVFNSQISFTVEFRDHSTI